MGKTRNALENIVPFIDACNERNLLTRVSCPISTKKGRQHIRGFLAYLECSDSVAVQQMFKEYNEQFACFKPLDVNPPSKRPYNPASTVGSMGNYTSFSFLLFHNWGFCDCMMGTAQLLL